MLQQLKILVLASLFIASALVVADDSALPETPLSPKHTIRISAGEWPPFIGPNLENNGFIAEIIREVFATQGYQVTFHFLPWSRAYHEAKVGNYDATAIWMYDEERTKDFIYSDPVSNEEFVFFYHVDSEFDWHNIEDIKGMHLGGGLGYSYGEKLNELIENEEVKMSRVNKLQQNLLRLAHKRIDLLPEEIHVAYHMLKQQDPKIQRQITHHPMPFLLNANYLLIPKIGEKSPEILSIFNQGLEKWKADNQKSSQ